MGWNEVDNKHKKYTDKNFVACEETYERAYIKKSIKEEFPTLSDAAIDNAIMSCCSEIKAPRPRQAYWECLKKKLGVG